MQIGLAGDWHGNFAWAKHVLGTFKRNGITNIQHVGDFGIGWPGMGEAFTHAIDLTLSFLDQTLYITPGNHENWELIDALPYQNGQAWIGDRICVLERNTRFEVDGRTFLSLGGAPSIDFPNRQEGISWWRGEQLTLRDVERAASEGHVDVMIAHDAPDGGTDKVQRIIDKPDTGFWTRQGLAYAAEGRELMNIAVAGVKPKLFVHGHFHVADQKTVGPTHFLSLHQDGKEKNGAILDTSDLSVAWLDTRR